MLILFMFISNVSILAVRTSWHHPVFGYPIYWSFDFVVVLLFTTYYSDKSAIVWHQSVLLDKLVFSFFRL